MCECEAEEVEGEGVEREEGARGLGLYFNCHMLVTPAHNHTVDTSHITQCANHTHILHWSLQVTSHSELIKKALKARLYTSMLTIIYTYMFLPHSSQT